MADLEVKQSEPVPIYCMICGIKLVPGIKHFHSAESLQSGYPKTPGLEGIYY